MKKLTAMLLALTMACGVLAGCNGTPSIPGEESSTPSSSTPAESSKAESSTPEVTEKNFDGVTVKVWGGDLLNNPDFEAFWAENAGGMKYEVVQADDVKMMSMVASGTAPDVWVLSAFSMGAMYAARGLYEPLDDYIANSDVFDMDNLADVECLYRFDGQEVGKGSTYGIVKDWSLDNQLFINKNVFNDCGIPIPDDKTVYTWDQIRDWAKQMIKFDEDGNQIRWGLASPTTFTSSSPLSWAPSARACGLTTSVPPTSIPPKSGRPLSTGWICTNPTPSSTASPAALATGAATPSPLTKWA